MPHKIVSMKEMRITYEQLGRMIANLSPEQRACDVTVINCEGESFAVDFRIVGVTLAPGCTKSNDPCCDAGLDDNHPVLFDHGENPNRATQQEITQFIAGWVE